MGCCADKKDKCCGISKVVIPAALGGHDGEYAPQNGVYQNTLVYYEASGVSYLYANDGSFEKLADGIAATIEVGETTTLAPGSDATVENVGTKYHAKLNFGIPQGEKGDAATISVGSTTTGAAGTDASVTNSGDEHDAVFDFVIPRGDKGDQGDAATINVGTVTTTTLEPGEQASATVTNSGTTENAVLDFGFDIPKGEKGDTGATGSIKSELVDPLPATGQEDTYYLTNDSATKGTATGNPIQLNLANQGKIEELKLNGNATQTTYSGKNLMPRAASDNTSSRQNSFNIDLPTGTYTISFDISNITLGSNTSFTPYMKLADENGGIAKDVVLKAIDSSTTAGRYYTTFTLNTAASSATSGQSNIRIPQTQWENGARCKLSNIQIESGSSMTAYEPFTNGPAPNPDYPQDVNVVTGEQNVEVVGKNLLGGLEITGVTRCTATLNGTTLTVTPNNTTQTTAVTLSLGSKIPAGTYTLNSATFLSDTTQLRSLSSAIAVYSFGNNYSNQTFTIEEVVDGIRFNWNAASSTDPFTVDLSTLQIESGSSATSYEPYHGANYEINLGKNLLDPSTLDQRVFENDLTNNYYYDANLHFALKAGETYTLSAYVEQVGATPYKLSALIGTANSATAELGTVQNLTTVGGRVSVTFSVSEAQITSAGGNNLFMRLPRYASPTTTHYKIKDIQLELDSQATSYAPYFTPIELAKIGTYQDYIWNDGGTWKVHKAIGKVVLNGTENFWSLYNTNTSIPAYNADISDCYQAPETATPFDGLSDYFSPISQGKVYAQDIDGVSYRVNRSAILIKNLQCTSLASFKTWLSTHNTTVYYALATPTDTAITEQTLIDQLNAVANAQLYSGENNIMNIAFSPNLAGDLEIGYASWVPGDRYDVYIWNDSTGWQIIHTADS